MNGMNEQIQNLHQQIGQIYQIIDKLSDHVDFSYGKEKQEHQNQMGITQVSDDLLNNSLAELKSKIASKEREMKSLSENVVQKVPTTIEDGHKDILQDPSDKNGYQISSNYCYKEDGSVSCEDKVQRLTAQLTAAYQRIAILEEKLIARRQKTETRQQSVYHRH